MDHELFDIVSDLIEFIAHNDSREDRATAQTRWETYKKCHLGDKDDIQCHDCLGCAEVC